MSTVAEEDPSRPPWPSSPSFGWTSGVDRLTGLPNGQPLVPRSAAAGGADAGERPAWTLGGSDSACTWQADTDYCPTCFNATHLPAADAQACCDLCTAGGAECWAAVFYEGECWWKPTGAQPVYSPGRVACWPAGHGPIPPTPPPAPTGVIETHGPYLHGSGFPAVNGASKLQLFPPNLPPALDAVSPIGPAAPGVYASEFGCVAFSSFESMAPLLAPDHWSVHGGAPADNCTTQFFNACTGNNTMAQRNYPCDNVVLTYFPAEDLDAVGQSAFQRQLWLCMLGQALELKGDIETRRARNSWGTLLWQLNEIWPTGGW
jgi:beta-mannosidase